MRRIKIDFYKSENNEGHDLDIGPLIVQTHGLPFARRRVDFGDSFLFLENVRTQGNLIFGEAVKAKMSDLPDKVSRDTGAAQELGLRANEGIGRHGHFLYDRANHALLLQRDREIRPPTFRESVATPIDQDFALVLILKPDALHRLQRMQAPRKVAIKVARPRDPQAFSGVDASAGHMIDILNEFEGTYIDVNVSVGKSKTRALNRPSVLRAITRFFERGRGEEVKKIVVSGRATPDAITEVIDLFEDRLVYEEDVDLVHRRLDPADCERALRRAHTQNLEYLRTYRHQA